MGRYFELSLGVEKQFLGCLPETFEAVDDLADVFGHFAY